MLSVIVPVHNEEDNIRTLISELVEVASHTAISEIIYVDDGSTDSTHEILHSMKQDLPILRVIRHSACAGQSAAFWSGVRAAENSLIVLMDGDGQNDPRDIQKLYDCYKSNIGQYKSVMVAGQREKRHDNFIRRVSSKLANRIRAGILHDQTRDTGCSLKLIHRKDYLHLPYFNHMHRFLPALLMRDHVHICHVQVSHRPRIAGKSKYGFWNRLWVGIIDLIGVKWLMCRAGPENFSSQEVL